LSAVADDFIYGFTPVGLRQNRKSGPAYEPEVKVAQNTIASEARFRDTLAAYLQQAESAQYLARSTSLRAGPGWGVMK
jgi:hypothetical protein